jgi:hypothetical protein
MKKGNGTPRMQTNPVIHAVGIGDRTRPACFRPAYRRRIVNTIFLHLALNPILSRANSDTILNLRYPFLSVSIRGLISSPTAWSRHLDLLRLIPAKSGLKIKKWLLGVRIFAFNMTFPSSHLIASSRAYSCLKKLFPRFHTFGNRALTRSAYCRPAPNLAPASWTAPALWRFSPPTKRARLADSFAATPAAPKIFHSPYCFPHPDFYSAWV